MHKDPNLIYYTNSPVNAETPLDLLQANFITPEDVFYMRNHGPVPEIDVNDFRLKVNGMVENELSLSLETLQKKFTKYTVMATLQCAGNRRDQLIEVAPVPGEVPWQSGAIGNATWSGVRLKEILKMAGVKDSASYAAFMGAEEVIRKNKNVGFGASIPIDKAMSNEVLLAYEMNEKPLEPLHGAPLRVVVPGYIGARSVKWLTEITLQETPSENYFQSHAYQLFPPQASAETVDWNAGLQLSELQVNCVITSPLKNETISKETIMVKGYALGARKIARVDVSINNGETWTTADLIKTQEQWAWTFWEVKLKLEKGEHQITARAFDTASNTQPEDAKHVWNFKGYMNNAWHRVKFLVK
jgi:sulfite oxidase